MNIQVVVTAAILFIIFVSLGIIISVGKGDALLTRSKEHGTDYIHGLRRFTGKAMFALGFSALLCIIGQFFSLTWVYELGLYLFFGIIIVVVRRNTSKKYKKK